MKQITYLWLLILCSISMSSKAQVVLKGIVYNAETKMPIESANVYISNSTKGTITNNKGYFNLTTNAVGRSELVVSFVGYETQTISITQDAKYLEVLLNPKYEDLQAVVVTQYEKNGWR